MDKLTKSEFIEVYFDKMCVNETRQYVLCYLTVIGCLQCPFKTDERFGCTSEMNEMFAEFKQEHPEFSL